MPFQKNLSIKKRGDTYPLAISGITINGVAQDLQGRTYFFTAKKSDTDPDANAVISETWTLPTGTPIYSTAVVISSEAMEIPEGNYLYDIQEKSVDGTIRTIIYGILPIKNDITRRTS